MITDVLDLDRMESGRVTLYPEEGVDLHEIVLNVVAMAQPNVVFPEAGRYSLQLYCAGTLLRERRIMVQRQGPSAVRQS